MLPFLTLSIISTCFLTYSAFCPNSRGRSYQGRHVRVPVCFGSSPPLFTFPHTWLSSTSPFSCTYFGSTLLVIYQYFLYSKTMCLSSISGFRSIPVGFLYLYSTWLRITTYIAAKQTGKFITRVRVLFILPMRCSILPKGPN